MNKNEFILQLRATATEIKPLTESRSAGSLAWNGSEYAKGDVKNAAPHALVWWSTLTTMADMLEAQESPLNQKQIDYINDICFGGMGSLNDLYFDPETFGPLATSINKHLNQCRIALFEIFNRKP